MSRQRDFLSSLPSDIINYCFRFVTDSDLRRARWTSRLFLRAYCRQYTGTTTPTIQECRSFISLCKLGYVLASVTTLNIQLSYTSCLFKHVTMENFPSVKKVTVRYVHLGCMPTNGNVTTLHMIGCTYHGKRHRRVRKQFPFYNVQRLRINGGSILSPGNGLPKLLQLRTLEIIDTTLTHPITKRRFPKLKTVEL